MSFIYPPGHRKSGNLLCRIFSLTHSNYICHPHFKSQIHIGRLFLTYCHNSINAFFMIIQCYKYGSLLKVPVNHDNCYKIVTQSSCTRLQPCHAHISLLSYLKPQQFQGLNKFFQSFPMYTMINTLGKSDTDAPFSRHMESFSMATANLTLNFILYKSH